MRKEWVKENSGETKPMTKWIGLIVSFGLLFWAMETANAQAELKRYRYKNRVLLVFAPSESDPNYQKQFELNKKHVAELDERDVIVVSAFAGDKRFAGLRNTYNVPANAFRVLLIGKDGHTAFRSTAPAAIDMLNSLIDKMPMRRDEMRKKKK